MTEEAPAATPVQTTPERPPRQAALAPRFNIEALVEKAIERGDVEVVERMLAMAERIKHEAARDAFNEAMAEFQRRCPPILKTETANIPSRTGRGYDYTYAPLEGILRVVLPLMGELGLSHRWIGSISGNGSVVVVNCRVSHVAGHFEESGEIPIPIDQGKAEGMGASAPQRIGIATTYGRRYSLLMVLGLNPEDDPDAPDLSGGSGSSVPPPRRREEAAASAVVTGAVCSTLPSGAAVGSEIELRTQIAKISATKGKTNDKEWTRFDIFAGSGGKVSTFSKTLADVAEGFHQSQELVAMKCKLTQQGWGVSEIWAADQPPEE